MAPERAYLIVGQVATNRPRACARARTTASDVASDVAPARTPRPSAHGCAVSAARPGSQRPRRVPAPRPAGENAVILIRRHRPGRHRSGTPGLRHWPARRRGGTAVRRRLILVFVAHRARHATAPPTAGGTGLLRYASLLIVISTVLVSGWFAASGASAFAQMVRP